MHNMKTLTIGALAAVLAVPVFAYDSVEALMNDFTLKQAEALKAYIAEHPKAEDVKMAESMLVRSLMNSDQHAEVVKLLAKKYDALLADRANASTRDIIGGCVMPLLSAQLELGDKAAVKTWLARVEKDFAEDADAEQIKRALQQFSGRLNMPSVGDTMELKFKAVDGRDVDLAALKGKVVLVDFWATWCGPCVQELPNVKKAYERFHDKGLEIIGISLDDDKTKLDAFLRKNELPWPQAFSGDGWDDATAKKYGIQSIPAMFLIGKDGKVVAVNTRGPALASKLEELLGK